jgi:hypothetical protein
MLKHFFILNNHIKNKLSTLNSSQSRKIKLKKNNKKMFKIIKKKTHYKLLYLNGVVSTSGFTLHT